MKLLSTIALEHSSFSGFLDLRMGSALQVQRFGLQEGDALEPQKLGGGFRLVSGRLLLQHQTGACLWLGPGDLMGFGHWPFGLPKWEHRAGEPTQLEGLSQSHLEQLLTENALFSFKIMQELFRQISEIEKQSSVLQGVLHEDQLFEQLKVLAKKFGRDEKGFLRMRASNRELAAYFGISLSSLRRSLMRLEELGRLERHRGKLRMIG